MTATITNIQGADEQKQALEVIAKCNGTVLSTESDSVGTIVRAEFNTGDDRDEVDVELCDLGFDVNWEGEDEQ